MVDPAAVRPTSKDVPLRLAGPPLWARLIVILAAMLTLAGAVMALVNPGMVSPHDEINGAVRVYASYLVSRNLAITLLLILLLCLGAWRALSQFMTMVALVQFLDLVMDCVEGRWTLVPGILLFVILFMLAANRLSPRPGWRLAAWRD